MVLIRKSKDNPVRKAPGFFMRLSFILVAAPLIFSCHTSNAFLNIESLRTVDQKGFNGAVGLSFSGKSGNVNRNNFNFESLNRYQSDRSEFLLTGSYTYGESASVRDVNQGYTHVRYTHITDKPVFFEAFNQLQFSEFQRLDLRALNGIGLRYKIFKEERVFFFAGSSVFHETERLEGLEGNNNFRGNLYLSLVLKPNKNTVISMINYYQPVVDDFKDFRIQVDLDFQNKLTKKLSIGTKFNFAHDSRPPAAVELTDSLYMFSFNYEL